MRKEWPICLIFALGACNKQAPVELPDESDSLFNGMTSLTMAYIDSITAATDSASAIDAFNRFNTLADSVNFSVPPDTDLLLTEAENDTLYKLISHLTTTYHEKLHSLSLHLVSDTVPESTVDQ